jgi:flagellar motility protein MotE (MotC chaperone)
MGVFDEKDILERLGAVWEAVKVLKANEDTLVSQISKQDSILKKFSRKSKLSAIYKAMSSYISAS